MKALKNIFYRLFNIKEKEDSFPCDRWGFIIIALSLTLIPYLFITAWMIFLSLISISQIQQSELVRITVSIFLLAYAWIIIKTVFYFIEKRGTIRGTWGIINTALTLFALPTLFIFCVGSHNLNYNSEVIPFSQTFISDVRGTIFFLAFLQVLTIPWSLISVAILIKTEKKIPTQTPPIPADPKLSSVKFDNNGNVITAPPAGSPPQSIKENFPKDGQF